MPKPFLPIILVPVSKTESWRSFLNPTTSPPTFNYPHPRAILPWTTLLLIFYPCCPMRGHIWTAFLNPIDRPPTSSTFFRSTLLSPSFHPKPLHYSSHPPLILIFMLLLISDDIHPNPGPIDPCSVCSRRVTWGNRSVQCTNCSLWVHLSCSGLSPADFRKISPGHSWTCPMCTSSSQPLPSLSHPNPVSSSFSVSPSIHTPNPPPSLTTRLPRCTKLIQFLSHNHYDLIFIQESHLSSDSTFRIPGYKTLQKNRSMTRRGTTNSTGNLGGGVLILLKNGLTYTSLSTQSLSSLDPISDYLAIAVKVKGASPIIFSTSMSLLSDPLLPTLAQNLSHPFSYHHPLPLTSSATLTAIIHPGTLIHRKTNQAKSCLIGSSLLIFYLLTTPNITPYYTVPPETALPLISP